ncbi:MAG TPA: anthranilate phosphoribosyltransferase [Candidatus Acidoferrales bacterium]|nr:anthranilate phosphoribosyltransferase [Candidatus Acidoferrales bacterium]
MTEFPALLRRVIAGNDLTAEETAMAIGAFMDESISSVQAGALLVALAAKGEKIDEVVGAARAMRQRALRVEHDLPLVIDIVGTGGDGARTINISTAAALVVAGAGIPVAKHGNRAASSACGSADVLEALGVRIDRSPEEAASILRRHRIAFLYAQRYHPAMKAVGPVRSQLGVRTIFNILGPLTNPAHAHRAVVGVAQAHQVDLVAEALQGLGAAAGAVIHAESGIDEVAGEGPTYVAQFDGGKMRRWTLDPANYGVRATLDELRGGDAKTNAAALLAIMRGEQSPRADVVVLNAALALVVAGAVEDIPHGMDVARESIAQGAALVALDALRTEHEVEFAR